MANTIAGFKVPKALRNSGILDSLLNSPLGRQILADALVAAATAAAAALVKHRAESSRAAASSGEAGDAGDKAARAAQELTQMAAGALGGFLGDAVAKVLPSPASGKAKRAKSGGKSGPRGSGAKKSGRAPKNGTRKIQEAGESS
jgi:hypothetical protein